MNSRHSSLFLLLLIACRADPRASLTAEARASVVKIHASSPELAARVALAVAQGLPFVEELPNVRRPSHPRIYAREVDGSAFCGETYKGGWIDIAVGRDCRALEYGVAHELTHYFIDDEWNSLPAMLEEGLCELVAQRAAPSQADFLRAHYALLTGTLIGGAIELPGRVLSGDQIVERRLSLRSNSVEPDAIPDLDASFRYTRREFAALAPEANREALTGLGFFIARRIGVAGLHALVEAARANGDASISAERICAAANLEPLAKRSWLASIQQLADGGAYELLLDEARASAKRSADPWVAIGESTGGYAITWTDSTGNSVGASMICSSSLHGAVPPSAVGWSSISVP